MKKRKDGYARLLLKKEKKIMKMFKNIEELLLEFEEVDLLYARNLHTEIIYQLMLWFPKEMRIHILDILYDEMKPKDKLPDISYIR
jgi:hypothetical protein